MEADYTFNQAPSCFAIQTNLRQLMYVLCALYSVDGALCIMAAVLAVRTFCTQQQQLHLLEVSSLLDSTVHFNSLGASRMQTWQYTVCQFGVKICLARLGPNFLSFVWNYTVPQLTAYSIFRIELKF